MNKSILVVIATLVAAFGINQANAATDSDSVVFKASASVISETVDPTVPPKPSIPPKPKPKPVPTPQ